MMRHYQATCVTKLIWAQYLLVNQKMQKRVGLVWYDEEWKRIFGGRGDEAGSGRVFELRRGGWDVVVV